MKKFAFAALAAVLIAVPAVGAPSQIDAADKARMICEWNGEFCMSQYAWMRMATEWLTMANRHLSPMPRTNALLMCGTWAHARHRIEMEEVAKAALTQIITGPGFAAYSMLGSLSRSMPDETDRHIGAACKAAYESKDANVVLF